MPPSVVQDFVSGPGLGAPPCVAVTGIFFGEVANTGAASIAINTIAKAITRMFLFILSPPSLMI
jgi:hypothetical protein